MYYKNNCIKFNYVFKKIKTYIKDKHTLNKIKNAYFYAKQKHNGQIRKNGQPFIIHPLWTIFFLAQWKAEVHTLIAGLLHDILEDTPTTFLELKKIFGIKIANLVKAVTKVSFFIKKNKKKIKKQYLNKLFIWISKDIQVIIIKLADRLHNLKTIQYLSYNKQKIIAKESLEIYSKIAYRIGMNKVQSIIENLSFNILNPIEYKKILQKLQIYFKKKEKQLYITINNIKTIFNNKQINIKIFGRIKSIYSIYLKMTKFKKKFQEINDILAIRIIVNNILNCYKVLKNIHKNFTWLNHLFKDYISYPKYNFYQSLHTTIITNNGYIFEIQIRSKIMNQSAEKGVAAHWRYKEEKKYNIINHVKYNKKQYISKRLSDLKKIIIQTHNIIK